MPKLQVLYSFKTTLGHLVREQLENVRKKTPLNVSFDQKKVWIASKIHFLGDVSLKTGENPIVSAKITPQIV